MHVPVIVTPVTERENSKPPRIAEKSQSPSGLVIWHPHSKASGNKKVSHGLARLFSQ